MSDVTTEVTPLAVLGSGQALRECRSSRQHHGQRRGAEAWRPSAYTEKLEFNSHRLNPLVSSVAAIRLHPSQGPMGVREYKAARPR